MTNAETIRQLRIAAVERGDCRTCRCRPARPGVLTCQDCSDRGKAVKRSLRARGRCSCGRKPRRGKLVCDRCAEKKARTARSRVVDCISDGVCPQCKRNGAAAGFTICLGCLEYNRTRARDLRALTIGRPLAPRHCTECGADDHNAQVHRRPEPGSQVIPSGGEGRR